MNRYCNTKEVDAPHRLPTRNCGKTMKKYKNLAKYNVLSLTKIEQEIQIVFKFLPVFNTYQTHKHHMLGKKAKCC